MGSSYDDGLKNVDLTEGIDGALTRFSSSFDARNDYETGRDSRSGRARSSQALIERTVEASVLTALLRRHGALHPPVVSLSGERSGEVLSEADFETFLVRLAEGNCAAALALLAPVRHPFGLLDDRMAGILAVAAQRLGDAWEQDRLCFVEVSLGLVTLQRLLHEFAPQPLATPLAERRMLLVPMPGEAHSFGLRMLGIRFQQAGWDCRCDATMREEVLLHLVAAERFNVVGLSVQGSIGERHAPELIKRLRKASREPKMCILLGGAPFAADPDKAMAAGADLPTLPFTELFEALERRIPAEGS